MGVLLLIIAAGVLTTAAAVAPARLVRFSEVRPILTELTGRWGVETTRWIAEAMGGHDTALRACVYHLLCPDPLEMLVRRGVPIRTPTYLVGEHLIWGATARILGELLQRVGA